METQKEYLSVKEIAAKLGYTHTTIYRYIGAKRLRAYKTGKEYRVEHSEFTRFMESLRYN